MHITSIQGEFKKPVVDYLPPRRAEERRSREDKTTGCAKSSRESPQPALDLIIQFSPAQACVARPIGRAEQLIPDLIT